MSAKQFSYFDDWKTAVLTCPKCGWSGSFEEAAVEYHEELMDCSCPVCAWPDAPMLAIVSYPTLEEAEANSSKLSREEKASLSKRKQFLAEVEQTRLKSPDDLPDVAGSRIVLSWEFREDQDGRSWTDIRHGAKVLHSERAVYEGAERFVEVAALLKQKYGGRVVDLVPSDASSAYLYGDNLKSPAMVERVRASLRE
jgi:hypothetical protein